MKKDIVKILIGVCGGMVFCLGLFTVIFYFIGRPWATALTGTVPMASETGVAFVFVGLAIILIGLRVLPTQAYRKITQSDIWER